MCYGHEASLLECFLSNQIQGAGLIVVYNNINCSPEKPLHQSNQNWGNFVKLNKSSTYLHLKGLSCLTVNFHLKFSNPTCWRFFMKPARLRCFEFHLKWHKILNLILNFYTWNLNECLIHSSTIFLWYFYTISTITSYRVRWYNDWCSNRQSIIEECHFYILI